MATLNEGQALMVVMRERLGFGKSPLWHLHVCVFIVVLRVCLDMRERVGSF